jgi:hypothetical protein
MQEWHEHDEKTPFHGARSCQATLNADGVIENSHAGGGKLMEEDESKPKAASGVHHVEKNVNEQVQVSPDSVGPQSTSRRCKKSLHIREFDVVDDTIEKPSKGSATDAPDIQEYEGEWQLHG